MQGADLIGIIDDGIYTLRDIRIYEKNTGHKFTVETDIGNFV